MCSCNHKFNKNIELSICSIHRFYLNFKSVCVIFTNYTYIYFIFCIPVTTDICYKDKNTFLANGPKKILIVFKARHYPDSVKKYCQLIGYIWLLTVLVSLLREIRWFCIGLIPIFSNIMNAARFTLGSRKKIAVLNGVNGMKLCKGSANISYNTKKFQAMHFIIALVTD